MSRYPHKNIPLKKPKFEKRAFDIQKTVRLGTKRTPLMLSVQSEARRAEVAAMCAERSWVCEIDVQADEDEDISAFTLLMEKQVVATTTRLAGRNEPCPCDSGKKYKQSCAA